jgi:hypothetical protein
MKTTHTFDLSIPRCPECAQPMHIEPIKRWDEPFRTLMCVSQRCTQVGKPWQLEYATGIGRRVEDEEV